MHACKRASSSAKSDTKTASDHAAADIEKAKRVWTKFNPEVSATQCTACSHFDTQCKGGRPKKLKVGAPKRSPSGSRRDSVADTELDGCGSVTDLDFGSVGDKKLDCGSVAGPSTSTPIKKQRTADTLMQTSPIMTDKMPPSKGLLKSVATSPFPFQKQKDLRQHESIQAPLTANEEAYFTKLTKLKMQESDDKKTLRCKTGGQPIVLKRITQPRKASALATSPLRRKRSKLLQHLRTNISGSSTDDSVKQQGSEIKTKTKTAREQILRAANCEQPSVSSKQSSALRTQLGLSWQQHRAQKRFLKSIGVNLACEKKERQEQKEAMFGDVVTETVDLILVNEDKSEVEKPTAVGRIEDITKLVTQLLDQYNKEGKLTWHNDTIPQDEIWVKVGGDHGGGSFKLTLQIANIANPNSKHNTCLFLISNCKDIPENLRRLLGLFDEQFTTLQTTTWRHKKIRLFFYGDYDFLLKIYGISGAQSTHPCIFCKA